MLKIMANFSKYSTYSALSQCSCTISTLRAMLSNKAKSLSKSKHIICAVLVLALSFNANAASSSIFIPQNEWSFEGKVGTYWDSDQLLRGYKVATQVCLSCHSMKYFNHREMLKLGFSKDQIKVLAKDLEMDINSALFSELDPKDAKEAYGVVPPDLSIITKGRPDGVNYVKALMLGYEETPEDFDGTNYNKYFAGNNIAMPSQLEDGMIEYFDGSLENKEQYAKDVAAFLAFAADPKRIERQNLGVGVLFFVIMFAILTYLTKRQIWKDVK
ncbi:MAG TPA: cytochrome c1 [Alphaproteobacteria bacterium]|nr:cytochrome c1 [Alphaproteobacteria bacterium]